MIPALLIGRGGSRGVPGKNTMSILGRPLMTYPILAARNSRRVDCTYLSTEAADIQAIGRAHGVEIINRPRELSTDQALVEDVVAHGFNTMRERGADVEMFVPLFCNTATITPGI